MATESRRKRSQMNIISQILEVAKNEGEYGASQTKIMYKASLSYEQLKEYLPILIDNGVLHHDEEARTLKITEKGQRFLEMYRQINIVTRGEQNTTTTTTTATTTTTTTTTTTATQQILRERGCEIMTPELKKKKKVANLDNDINNSDKPLPKMVAI